MRDVVFNPYFLKEDMIEKKSKKVRALIIDSYGNITITKCGDILILPGGKIEKDETTYSALKRELSEELGCSLVGVPTKFLKTTHYLKDYPELYKNTCTNKVTETTYFFIPEGNLVKDKNISLDEKEIRGGFTSCKIPLDQLHCMIKFGGNARENYFNTELYTAIINYNNFIPENTNVKLLQKA